MKRSLGGGRQRAESRRGDLWVWPTLAAVAAFLLATALIHLPADEASWARWVWPGDSDAAASVIQVIAGAAITVTTLTFSLTVLALQLASQQFSPRLLREFARDRVTRVVLSVLVGTFVMALTVLRHLGADDEPPQLAVLGVLISGLASLATLLGFISHVVRLLRVDTMMATVHHEASTGIETFYPRYGDEGPRHLDESTTPPGDGHLVRASRSGFVRMIHVDELVGGAAGDDVFLRLIVRPGDHVVLGTPMAVGWAGAGGRPHDSEELDRLVHEGVELGYERTVEQDAAYGFRQLADIAVKALSPGINDPVTGVHAIGYLTDLLVRLLGCRLGDTVHEDDRGRARVIVPDRDLAYYVDLACGQVRRYGRSEPTVLAALLRMLRDAGASCRDQHQRDVIAAEARRVVDIMDSDLLEVDQRIVTDLADRVQVSLEGRLVDAYLDRSGETRSI